VNGPAEDDDPVGGSVHVGRHMGPCHQHGPAGLAPK